VEPQNIIECSVAYEDPGIIKYGYPDENEPIHVSVGSQPLFFTVFVKNVFDETLQDDALISGQIEIWHATLPQRYSKIKFTKNDVASTKVIDPMTGILTLNANENFQIHAY
jgi:hypothetical protein